MTEHDGIVSELFAIDKQIREMEAKTGLTSEEFYQLWSQGIAKDTFENNAWAILIEGRDTLMRGRGDE